MRALTGRGKAALYWDRCLSLFLHFNHGIELLTVNISLRKTPTATNHQTRPNIIWLQSVRRTRINIVTVGSFHKV